MLNVVGPDFWGVGGSDAAADFGAVGEGRGVRDGSGAAARDVAGGGVEAFDRFGEGRVGEAAAQRAGALAGAGGEADAGGAGVDRPVSRVLGGESGSVREIFGHTTNKGKQT